MKKFPVNLSPAEIRRLLNQTDPYSRRFTETSLRGLLGLRNIPGTLSNQDNAFPPVPWEFEKLRERIRSKISPHIHGWYDEGASAAGDSTAHNIAAFSHFRFVPHYLNPDKSFRYATPVTLSSRELGVTRLTSPTPVFAAPYGSACLYGGQSDEIALAQGVTDADVVHSIGTLTGYSLEEARTAVTGNRYYFRPGQRAPSGPAPFTMFQLYLTEEDDINRSLIERAKRAGVSVILFTIDAGAGHGGIPMMDLYADFTFSARIAGNLLHDPVFHEKCFRKCGCTGTRSPKLLAYASRRLGLSVKKLADACDPAAAFDYGRAIQFGGMGRQNATRNARSASYPWSVEHIARLCHSRQNISPAHPTLTHRRGLPLAVKGVMSVEDARQCQESGADAVYVSNHGGRFVFNSIAPIDVLPEIRKAVKKKDRHFGVWFDSGVRSAADVLIAYSQGAEFVGIGRPVIYACVDNGRGGVRQVLQGLLYTLRDQARLCGLQSASQIHDHPGIVRRS
jgi:lactate 2-monooxygenase